MKNIITFGTFSKEIYYTDTIHPVPMSEYKVDWYENIKAEKLHIDNEEGRNVKSCPSFTEIYKEGFVIPAPSDYKIRVTPDNILFWEAARSFSKVTEKEDIEHHYNEQYVDYMPSDFETKMIVKINTPWKVFTPKGYSIRMMKMPFDSGNKWEATYGVLRSDKNYHLNFQVNIKTNNEIFIKQGEPLGIIVPFKRENFKSNIVDLNEKNKYSIAYYKQFLKTYGSFKMNFRKDYWSEE